MLVEELRGNSTLFLLQSSVFVALAAVRGLRRPAITRVGFDQDLLLRWFLRVSNITVINDS